MSRLITNFESLSLIENDIVVSEMVDIYNENLSTICNEISPVLIKNVKERPQQVWYNENLQTMKREKRKAERKFLNPKLK